MNSYIGVYLMYTVQFHNQIEEAKVELEKRRVDMDDKKSKV